MLQGLMRPGVELGRPGRGRGFDPEVAEKGQTVREEATADDEYTLVPERAQPPANLEELLWVEAGHRDLQHRDVRGGIHHRQGHVRAVVEAALRLVGNML